MGLHHRREDQTVTEWPLVRLVPADAPPAGLGYPPPAAYRLHPVTGRPTPPRGSGPAPRTSPPGRPGRRHVRAASSAPLAVAVAGAAVALVGAGAQLPGLVEAIGALPGTSAPAAAPAPATPGASAVARQCATVVADALDGTVTTLGRTPSTQWAGVVDARESALASTYGTGSPEHRAYADGVDDVLAWLREGSSEDWTVVTDRVARGVASTCSA